MTVWGSGCFETQLVTATVQLIYTGRQSSALLRSPPEL